MRASILFICALGCLVSTNERWEIVFQGKLSEKSRFYVLHDWSKGVYEPADSSPFPVSQISDIMLKTMGIWKDGVNWPGVKLSGLFSRPRATVLFILDGLSDSLDIKQLSDKQYSVDGGSLNGNVQEDTNLMFRSDNILSHFNKLFDGKSISLFVSGKGEASLDNKETTVFDLNSIEDVAFLGELAVIRNTVLKLPVESINDGNPDAIVFSFSSVKALQDKYGPDSKQMAVAVKMVTDTIEELTKGLVDMYQGDVIIQAVVLQWSQSSLSADNAETKMVLNKYFSPEQVTTIMSSLPSLSIPEMDYYDELALCSDLSAAIEEKGGVLKAQCTVERNRLRREADVEAITYQQAPSGVTEERDEDFPATFLMIFVTVVPLALSLYAISWAMWNMDPGTDSVIYRNTDTQGIKLH